MLLIHDIMKCVLYSKEILVLITNFTILAILFHYSLSTILVDIITTVDLPANISALSRFMTFDYKSNFFQLNFSYQCFTKLSLTSNFPMFFTKIVKL
mgnify:CR=1 FL=1